VVEACESLLLRVLGHCLCLTTFIWCCGRGTTAISASFAFLASLPFCFPGHLRKIYRKIVNYILTT